MDSFNRHLYIDPPPRNWKIRLYGGCVAENIIQFSNHSSWDISHILYLSGIHEIPSIPEDSSLQGIAVVFALRTVIGQAAQKLTGIDDADLLFYKELSPDVILQTCKEVLDCLINQFTTAIRGRIPLFVISFIEPLESASGLFSSRHHRGIYRLTNNLNNYLADKLDGTNHAYYMEINDLFRGYGNVSISDGYDICFAHAGLTGEQNHSFRLHVIQRLDRMLTVLMKEQPVKLIITDLDNTLWKGVLAETDHIDPGYHTEGWPLGYVEALMECKRRGIILAICSKNDETLTRQNFDKVWYGRIKWDDFAMARVNWNPKSENIRDIIQAVNVLPENVLFIDDSHLEIEEVSRVFPLMRKMTGDQTRWRMELLYAAPLQVPIITDESKSRTESIRAKIERDRHLAITNREEYLRDLHLAVHIELVTIESSSFSRVTELLNKSNQFNTTGVRWNNGEINEFIHNGGKIYALSSRDRIIDHGIVGVALVNNDHLRQLVLSCRIFGLGIEDSFLHYLAVQNGDRPLYADWIDSGKNATAQEFLERHFLDKEGTRVLLSSPALPSHITLY